MKTAEVVELPNARLGEEAFQRSKRYMDNAYAKLRQSNFSSRVEHEAAVYDIGDEGIRVLRRSAIQIDARKRLGQILAVQIEAISKLFALVESGEMTLRKFEVRVKKDVPFVAHMFVFAQRATDNPNNPFTYEENIRAIIDELMQTYPYTSNPSES